MVSLLLVIIYLSFISLGLPDALLGAAWPTMHNELEVPLSYSGMIFMIISLGTVVSSLNSDRLTRKFGTGGVTAVSVLLTALALFGFSTSHSFLTLCLWAIPYGLGAGSVDAALNNYVALHYASRHMSWLHCMWGVGTIVGPYVMGAALTHGASWNGGYRGISILQLCLAILVILSLPLWRRARKTVHKPPVEAAQSDKPMSFWEILRLPGAKSVMLCFFLYCGIEQTVSLWASSFLVTVRGIDTVTAARFGSLFFIGITVGRGISGFATMKFSDSAMVRIGEVLIGLGVVMCLLPFGNLLTLAGIVTIGLGCAPIYPSIIHSTPEHFGAGRSQAVIGVEMAMAYIGILSMPPIFGWISEYVGLWCLPVYLGLMLVAMVILHEVLCKKTKALDAAP